MVADVSVHKFGGTSMGGPEQISQVAGILLDSIGNSAISGMSAGFPVVAVVSAMSKITDALQGACSAAAAKDEPTVDGHLAFIETKHMDAVTTLFGGEAEWVQLFKYRLSEDLASIKKCLTAVLVAGTCPQVFADIVMGYGEKWSCEVLAHLLDVRCKAQGAQCHVKAINARDFLYLKPCMAHTSAAASPVRIDIAKSRKLLLELLGSSEVVIPVITGFVCCAADGSPCTLKRNGSDHSAAIVANLLFAKCLTIWTDVDAVFAADPRKVKDAQQIPFLTYSEAAELAYFGAKVLHPMTMRPCVTQNIPIWLKNTFKPELPGTLIASRPSPALQVIPEIESPAKAFTLVKNIALVTLEGTGMIGVQGIAARLFAAVQEAQCNVVMITQASSEHSICFAIKEDEAARCKAAIERAFYIEMNAACEDERDLTSEDGPDMCCTVLTGMAILAAVGDEMVRHIGVLGRLSKALSSARVNIVALAQGSSERNVTFVVSNLDAEKGLAILHDCMYRTPGQSPMIKTVAPDVSTAAVPTPANVEEAICA